ncbi:MAG: HAMP domain-containing sensor histidine kinase [Cytophagales bacterium]|nr:HAMP domain-containing sensor histidine kinase [Cytophagales bacterium]
MSRLTLRIVIILAALSIAGITATQIYWVRKAFDLKENQFNRDVTAALTNVATKILEITKTPTAANNPVTQLTTNYFVVLVNGPIDNNLLEFLLLTEFEKRNIKADFEYGIYDCMEQCMQGGNHISPKNTASLVNFTELPAWKNDGYYFGVQFPMVEATLISQMGIWGFSSVVMLIVIFFFVYTLFVILKQRRLSEIQKDFINNMTHEFKTPLSTIAISTSVLKDPAIIHTPERLLNYATIIDNENNRLKQQVERVLQMARLDTKEIGLKKEVCDLHELIREAKQNNLVASKVNVELALEASPSSIRADKLHLTNVIFNLLDNAIKYNKQQPIIRISTSYTHGNLILRIEDNGIGIKSEDQKKIFHRFYRVPTGNLHDVKGFGLGLSYVKLIVEAHKGKITLTSEPDKGSCFSIALPGQKI